MSINNICWRFTRIMFMKNHAIGFLLNICRSRSPWQVNQNWCCTSTSSHRTRCILWYLFHTWMIDVTLIEFFILQLRIIRQVHPKFDACITSFLNRFQCPSWGAAQKPSTLVVAAEISIRLIVTAHCPNHWNKNSLVYLSQQWTCIQPWMVIRFPWGMYLLLW